MEVSILIPTRNRAERLRRVLESMCRMVVPERIDWEVVVVNNASTDNTSEVIAEFARRLPLRSVVEHVPGIAAVRNRSLEEGRGDLLFFVDDDVEVGRNWMLAYWQAASRHAYAVYFAGPVAFRTDVIGESWIKTYLRCMNGHQATVSEEKTLKPRQTPLGANYALRRLAVEKVPFDERLGHHGSARGYGEDTAFFLRLERSGARGLAVPGARVSCSLPYSELTKRYVLTQAFLLGQSNVEVRLRHAFGHRRPSYVALRLSFEAACDLVMAVLRDDPFSVVRTMTYDSGRLLTFARIVRDGTWNTSLCL